MYKIFKTLTKINIKDHMVLSLVSGLLGTLVMDLSNLLLWRTKKAEMLYGHLAGSMIMRGYRTNRTKNFVLGQIFHLITGSALGIPIYGVIKISGERYRLIKGAFMGLMSWGVLNNFGQRIGLFSTRAHLTKTHYACLWNNLLYGITTAELIIRLGDKSILNEQTQYLSSFNGKTEMTDNEFDADVDNRTEGSPIAYH